MGERTQDREERASVGDTAVHGETPAGGVAAARYLIANGPPDPARIAGLLVQYAVEADAIIAMLHATLGNTFVGQVLGLHDAATKAGPDGADATEVLSGEVHQSAAPAPTPTTGSDPVDELLRKKPTGTRGPNGNAAWLLKAIDLGLVAASEHSTPQLHAFADDAKTIHSNEKKPSDYWEKRGRQKAADKGHPIDNVRDAKGGYDVDVDEAPILDTMVAVARTRISAWHGSGKPKRVVLEIDDFVRGDPGYGGSEHTAGRAVDMNLSESEAIALLLDLPPGKTKHVFPDTSFHINRDGDGYDFGFVFGPGFFPPELDLDRVKQEKIAKEGSDHTKELDVEGLVWGSWVMNRSKAKWDGKKWAWTDAKYGPDSQNYLKSAKLKDTLANLGKKP